MTKKLLPIKKTLYLYIYYFTKQLCNNKFQFLPNLNCILDAQLRQIPVGLGVQTSWTLR